jgi:hypothetical protein
VRLRPLTLLLFAVLACAALPASAHARPLPEPGEYVETTEPAPAEPAPVEEIEPEPVVRPPSRALGKPWRGKLRDGVPFPPVSEYHVTWDPIWKQSPNRLWRRWATDRTVARTLAVLQGLREDFPDAPPVLVGDLSRRSGGDFGAKVGGGLGHGSHQNGLDVDIYYPRRDRVLRAPLRPAQVDRVLAQELVDRFVDAGAVYVFTGPRLGLKGPKRIVQPLVYHDDHLHVRFLP